MLSSRLTLVNLDSYSRRLTAVVSASGGDTIVLKAGGPKLVTRRILYKYFKTFTQGEIHQTEDKDILHKKIIIILELTMVWN